MVTIHGSFFLGSNKVMQVALGRDETTEFRPQLQALGVRLVGFAGLLCTECVGLWRCGCRVNRWVSTQQSDASARTVTG
jgi:hypothetical protein